MSPSRQIPVPKFGLPLWGAFGLLVVIMSIYLLTASREKPWGDATPVYQVAESVVLRGAIDIPTPWPPTVPLGRGGKIYAIAPFFQSVVHIPGVWLREQVATRWPVLTPLLLPWSAHIGPAFLGALTCVLFFCLCRREGVSLFTSIALLAALAFGSSIWVYARYPYSEILQALCVTGFFGQVLAARRDPTVGRILALAVWAGLLINSKPVFAPALPVVAVYWAWDLRHNLRRLIGLGMVGLLGFLPFLGVILAYNHARYAASLSTGYGIGRSVFSASAFFGFWGLFLSPGKSLLLFSPPLFLAVAALPLFKSNRNAVWSVLLVSVPTSFLYARFIYWSGDWAWGPRYIVPFVPVFLFPAAMLLDWTREQASRIWRWVSVTGVAVVFLWGVAVQIIGNGLYWDHYIRLSTEVGTRWLGEPNRLGSPAYLPNNCGACFEEMSFMQWVPALSPIRGQAWLLKHVYNKDEWPVASKDAPWLDYTNVEVDAVRTYDRARIDWWYRDYYDKLMPEAMTIFKTLFSSLAFGLVLFCGGLWWSSWRRRLVEPYCDTDEGEGDAA
ncbi:MAG: hypothetical protein SGI86_09290 [Deltaproteobacteria bacterium]|nr:hypothetical protein [Deltaproteobacteria bacterium]